MRTLIAATWLILVIFGAGSAEAGGRVDLFIGNGAYKNVPKLENAQGDARAMTDLLKSVGFDVVEGTDLTRDKMTERFLEFSKKAKDADIAIFYFAGRGVAIEGANYALPLDADIKTIAVVKLGAAIDLESALAQTMVGVKVSLSFPSVSRATPYATPTTPARMVSVPGGAPSQMRTDEGTLLAFATGPGQSALDGPKGDHSPFTQALLDHIAQPGVEIQQAMTEVRAQVSERTNKQQLPWGNSNLV